MKNKEIYFKFILSILFQVILLLSHPLASQPALDGFGIWVTGRNAEGQLGNSGTGPEALSMIRISGDIYEEVIAMAAGENQSYFLTKERELWASGANDHGQLGDGSKEMRANPVKVINADNVISVFAGKNHGLFIKADGTLWAVGANQYGQLGDGTSIDRSEAVQVAEQVLWAAGGEAHSLFVKTDGSLWAVGLNNRGQLGNGSTNNENMPVQIATNVTRVYAGWLNSYFIKEDKTLWAVGDNSFGMLGTGKDPAEQEFITTPQQVKEGSSVEFMAVKDEHMYFVKTNRQLWAAGHNQFGQLGNGLHEDRYAPVKVINGTNVIAVAAGSGYGAFVRADSTLWAMGNPEQGRMAFDASDEQKMPLWAFNHYKGDVHNHSSYTWSHGAFRNGNSKWDPILSDWDPAPGWNGNGGPNDYPPVLEPMGVADPKYYKKYSGPQVYQMDRARNKGPRYEFYNTADHCIEEPFHPVDPVNNPYWLDIRESARNTRSDSVFVGMSGMEFSRNSDPQKTGTGHMVMINTHDYISASDNGFPELFNWLKTARPLDDIGYVVLDFAHPGQTQYNDWAHWDPQIVDIATLCEITTVYRSRYLPGWNRSLNKGWKTSPTGVQDSHGYWNLENRAPLTNVIATELTTEAITRAMRQRRTYVSWTGEKSDNVDNDLRYSVNGYIMGSTLDSPGTFNFHIEIQTPPGRKSHYVRRIQIVRNHPTNMNGTQVAAEKVFPGTEEKVVWTPTIVDNDAKWFYLIVHHWEDTNNNPDNTTYNALGSTYSAPIWTGKGTNHGDGSHALGKIAIKSLSTPIKISYGVTGVATGNSHTMVLGENKLYVSVKPPTEQSVNIHIFPNPAMDFLNITVDDHRNEIMNFNLLDLSGKIVKSWSSSDKVSNIEISYLASGFYVLMIDIPNKPVIFEKVIINH